MGDAAGIGPEIIVKSLARKDLYDQCKPVVIGDAKILKRAAKITNSNVTIRSIQKLDKAQFKKGEILCIDLNLLPEDLQFGKISAISGDASFQYLKTAIELAKNNKIKAICTAPLSKEALHKGGHMYPGHTEILAELTDTKDFAMMLISPELRVIHLTTHIGLLDAIKAINPERTYKVIKLAHDALSRAGIENPRIAVCGINPHAGESGLFGYGEEEEKLVPGIKKAAQVGIDVSGPYPADTLFFRAVRGDFDIVVACYHDQGHIPIKVLGLETGVNITVGLNNNVIRTSVDHGTAYDIAGKNIADEQSLLEAIQTAIDLLPKSK